MLSITSTIGVSKLSAIENLIPSEITNKEVMDGKNEVTLVS